MKKFWFKKVLMFTCLFIIAVLVFGGMVMALWNAILPAVLGVKTITFMQALGILLLSKILFGGFHGKRGIRERFQWKHGMQEKWANMTPEEKEKFKTEWRSRCNTWRMNKQDNSGAMAE